MLLRSCVAIAALCLLPSIAHAQAADFTCPETVDTCDEDPSGCCEPGFVKYYDQDAEDQLCRFEGTKTYFDEDVDEHGKSKRFVTGEGTCQNGLAQGDAWSVEIADGGNITTRGAFDQGVPVGAHVRTQNGVAFSIACFPQGVDPDDDEPETLWSYDLETVPEKPSAPSKDDFESADDLKEAKGEYKEAMAEYKAEFAVFKADGKRLGGLAAACPAPNDDLCAYASEMESESGPGEEFCENGYALVRGQDGPLVAVRTSQGLMSLVCNIEGCDEDEDDGCARWGADQPAPPEKPIKPRLSDFKEDYEDIEGAKTALKEAMGEHKEEMASFKVALSYFKKNAASLQKYAPACANPNDSFCVFLDTVHGEDAEEDESAEEEPEEATHVSWTEVDENTCIDGRAVLHQREVLGDGAPFAYSKRTSLGMHEAKCEIRPEPDEDDEDDEDDEEAEPEELWSVTLEPIEGDWEDTPPKRADFEDDASFKEEQAMYKEGQAEKKEMEAEFRVMAKHLESAFASCPAVIDDTCYFQRMENEGGGTFSIEDGLCMGGLATSEEGKVIEKDDEEYAKGFHKTYNSLGILEASCHKYETGREDGETFHESNMIWEIANDNPDFDPGPPVKADFEEDDVEGFATAKEEYAAYQQHVKRFVEISKEIAKLGKKCPRVDNTICRAEGICQESGLCKYDKEEEACGAATTAHCKQSDECKKEGKCVLDPEEAACVESGP
jgi:hypothetical protein